jgi:hypothetical protein
LKIDRLDDKPQRRAHSIDIFIHDPFDNGGFARVVEAAARSLAAQISRAVWKDQTASARASPYPSTEPS